MFPSSMVNSKGQLAEWVGNGYRHFAFAWEKVKFQVMDMVEIIKLTQTGGKLTAQGSIYTHLTYSL